MVFQTALRSLSNRSKVVVGNYCNGPMSAEPYREKNAPFTPSSILFRPRQKPPRQGLEMGFGGGAGYRPRVRMVYCDGHLFP